MSLFLKILALVALCYFFSLGMTYHYQEDIVRLKREFKQREEELEEELLEERLLRMLLEKELKE